MRTVRNLFGFAVSLPAAIWGQPSLSVQDAVARALASHPALSAGAARVSVSTGLAAQAALRPNPRIVLQTENWRASSGFRRAGFLQLREPVG